MINLMPPEDKKNIRAARANVLLMRYSILTVIIIAASLVLLVGVYYLLINEKNAAEARTNENNQAVANYSDVKARSDNFRSELSQAGQHINGSVHFSALLREVTRLLPSGTSIDQLQLESTDVGQTKSLTVLVLGESQAYQLRDNFASSTFFSGVAFDGVSQNSGATASRYPYTVTLRFTIIKGMAD